MCTAIEQGGFRSQRGVSLMESIVFMVVVGVALAGVLTVFNATVMHSADPIVRKQMLTIAEALLDEVAMQPFTVCDPTDANAAAATTRVTTDCATRIQGFGQPPGPVANRSFFNNVGNYCSEVGTGGGSCGTLVLGSAFPCTETSTIPDLTGAAGPPGFCATITLTAESLGGIPAPIPVAANNPNSIRITVTVGSSKTSETITLDGYRTRWSPAI